VHYAGHAFFDPASPGRSGLVCSDGDLAGEDLESLSRLPSLFVANACESGRVRQRAARSRRGSGERAAAALAGRVGLAEALLRGGVANFIGTYWPVGDSAALAFAEVFYARLLANDALGAAVLAARRRVRDLRSPDWADYIHYGDPDFRLKLDAERDLP
jgi:CHAT domain-containing protein